MTFLEEIKKFREIADAQGARQMRQIGTMEPEDIQALISDPSYHRVVKILLHCYNAKDFPANVPDLIAGSDARGKNAILSILSEYAENIEDGWICPIARALLENQSLVIN